MKILFCIAIIFSLIPMASGRSTTNMKGQTDPFLTSGHDLVRKLCQGELGCGDLKTSWEQKDRPHPSPDRTYMNYIYGGTLTEEEILAMESEATSDNFLESNAESPLPGLTTPAVTDETSTEFSFISNESVQGLDEAVKILCDGSTDCETTPNSFMSTAPPEMQSSTISPTSVTPSTDPPNTSSTINPPTPADKETNGNEVIIIATVTGTLIVITMAILIGATYYCTRRHDTATGSDVADVDADDFEFVDLSTLPPPPPPPPSSPSSAKYIFDYGRGRVVQVTEL